MYYTIMDPLIEALLEGDQERSVGEARKLLDSGVPRERIITEGLEGAMARLNAKCTVDEFNLLEIMLCGRAATGVMKEIFPPDKPLPKSKGAAVVATLEGDVHDLGKNILKMVLTASGYRVVDCGKDCPVERLLDTAEAEKTFVVGISGLISTVLPQVRGVKEKMVERGLGHMHLMAGGAALKQSSPESLNVDYVAQTAFDGLHHLEALQETG